MALIMFEFEKQSILSDFPSQIRTPLLILSLSLILDFHLRIYIFRQRGDTQKTLAERMK
jgi:hypothetical protein